MKSEVTAWLLGWAVIGNFSIKKWRVCQSMDEETDQIQSNLTTMGWERIGLQEKEGNFFLHQICNLESKRGKLCRG